MKTLMTSLTTLFLSTQVLADGWVCEEKNGGPLKVQAYNNNKGGTRTAAALILSNTDHQYGRRTILKFSDGMNRFFKISGSDVAWLALDNSGSVYTGKTYFQYNAHKRSAGEIIPNSHGEGARVRNVDHVVLDVDFSYGRPIANGALADATFTVQKRNGESFSLAMSCERYLKGAQ